jgi:acyl dehydratase
VTLRIAVDDRLGFAKQSRGATQWPAQISAGYGPDRGCVRTHRRRMVTSGILIINLEREMTISTTDGLVTDIAGLSNAAGSHLGYTEWREMTQERVDQFADVTEDHNFIHVDPERANQTPFGGTIAHGFLSLSLLAPVSQQLLQITDVAMGVNYGLDRVRFPAPLPVGARWRGGAEIVEVTEIPGGLQVKLRLTVEVEGSDKPAVVADSLIRAYA